jgi:hypothetical protein
MRLRPGLRASEGRRRCRHGPAVAPLLARREARRVAGRRMPSPMGLTSLLSRVRGYSQRSSRGPIRGPALMSREVCWPRTPRAALIRSQ